MFGIDADPKKGKETDGKRKGGDKTLEVSFGEEISSFENEDAFTLLNQFNKRNFRSLSFLQNE